MFTFPVTPAELFHERSQQMRLWGIPTAVLHSVQAAVDDSWRETAGGWAFEWTKQAELAERRQNWPLASACYAAARFPSACTPYRQIAQAKHVACFLKSSSRFPCAFERQILAVPYQGRVTPVPVHIYSRKSSRPRPVVALSGGVDTYKIEIHRLAVALALLGDFKVVALDMPGTGESAVALSPQAHEIYDGVIQQVAGASGGKVKTAAMGMSFGGAWSTKLTLMNLVDCGVDVGGPLGFSPFDGGFLLGLPNGMPGIIGNALRLDDYPDHDTADRMLAGFSLAAQGLLDPTRRTPPLLVLNGAEDQYIPAIETTALRAFPAAEVWVVKGATHCAVERLPRCIPLVIAWLRLHLHGETLGTRAALAAAKAILPPMEL